MPAILISATHKDFIDYLVELSDYESKKPVGADATFGKIIMINATKTYTNDEKEVTATIHVSNQSSTVMPLYRSGLVMKKDNVVIKVIWIKGFLTQISYDIRKHRGTMTVFLHSREKKGDVMGTMTFSLKNVSMWEGVLIVKRFNLAGIKRQIEKIEND